MGIKRILLFIIELIENSFVLSPFLTLELSVISTFNPLKKNERIFSFSSHVAGYPRDSKRDFAGTYRVLFFSNGDGNIDKKLSDK